VEGGGMMKFLPLVLRNLARNKLRNTLTVGAVGLAIALVCLLLTMPSGLDALLTALSSKTRIVVHNRAGLDRPLPYSVLQKIASLLGVVAAASWEWYGGVLAIEKGVTFPSFAVEPEAVGTVWADWKIDAQQLAAFRRYRNGAIVGRGTLKRHGWEIGDLVTLQGTTSLPVDLSFRIVGEIPDDRLPHFLFQREYIDQRLRAAGLGGLDTVMLVWVRVDDPARVAPLMSQIDRMFENSEEHTESQTEKSFFVSFFGNLSGVVTLILIVTALVALCIVFMAANTASMSVRERFVEIAVLKALGFKRRLIFALLVAETTILSGIGGVLGSLASLGLTQLLEARATSWDPSFGPLARFVVTKSILVQGLFLALFIGMISGVVPAFGAARRSVAETLRDVF
jgi:putative ABC transport system permease protein